VLGSGFFKMHSCIVTTGNGESIASRPFESTCRVYDMSKRMMFFPSKRRGPRASTVVAGLMLASITGGAFAAGLHVGVTYGAPNDTPRVMISAASLSAD